MRTIRRPAALLVAVSAGLGIASLPADAQDVPPAPADRTDAPPADAPTDDEDAAARKLLEAAADRQGGKSVAPPDGKLESFRIVFHRLTLHRLVEREGGTTRQRMMTEENGLILDWKGGQIRTEWRLQGDRPTIRGVGVRRTREGEAKDWPWLFDGNETRSLTTGDHDKDLAEIERDRRIVKALLQVAILRSMLHDGSRWKIVDDTSYPGTALRRTPPADAEVPLRLTLWIDSATKDVSAARLLPNEPGESIMSYLMQYDASGEWPRVKGAEIRFPYVFDVYEQRVPEQEPQPVMTKAAVGEVRFNDVPDEVFSPPATRR